MSVDALLALLLGATVGFVCGGVTGLRFAAGAFGRAIRRELDAGVIDRSIAERLTDVRARP